MKVIEFKNEDYVKSALKNCNWDVGAFLHSLIEENRRDIGLELYFFLSGK